MLPLSPPSRYPASPSAFGPLPSPRHDHHPSPPLPPPPVFGPPLSPLSPHPYSPTTAGPSPRGFFLDPSLVYDPQLYGEDEDTFRFSTTPLPDFPIPERDRRHLYFYDDCEVDWDREDKWRFAANRKKTHKNLSWELNEEIERTRRDRLREETEEAPSDHWQQRQMEAPPQTSAAGSAYGAPAGASGGTSAYVVSGAASEASSQQQRRMSRGPTYAQDREDRPRYTDPFTEEFMAAGPQRGIRPVAYPPKKSTVPRSTSMASYQSEEARGLPPQQGVCLSIFSCCCPGPEVRPPKETGRSGPTDADGSYWDEEEERYSQRQPGREQAKGGGVMGWLCPGFVNWWSSVEWIPKDGNVMHNRGGGSKIGMPDDVFETDQELQFKPRIDFYPPPPQDTTTDQRKGAERGPARMPSHVLTDRVKAQIDSSLQLTEEGIVPKERQRDGGRDASKGVRFEGNGRGGQYHQTQLAGEERGNGIPRDMSDVEGSRGDDRQGRPPVLDTYLHETQQQAQAGSSVATNGQVKSPHQMEPFIPAPYGHSEEHEWPREDRDRDRQEAGSPANLGRLMPAPPTPQFIDPNALLAPGDNVDQRRVTMSDRSGSDIGESDIASQSPGGGSPHRRSVQFEDESGNGEKRGSGWMRQVGGMITSWMTGRGNGHSAELAEQRRRSMSMAIDPHPVDYSAAFQGRLGGSSYDYPAAEQGPRSPRQQQGAQQQHFERRRLRKSSRGPDGKYLPPTFPLPSRDR
ncbi:unnamed protein product [Vitrella brassicaformis CCMP3155]|uniref:Uncharacterized protein n=2 Tax=Vitrella brassicaformis TaxID=1169539 RepID=A0A0G4F814_VITBC|nr:unnamed protein product [Vitrella brassicaformis CCMP3155]|eukprot:CEM08441.1 unnamed protein product [Vitrella brassicaformis CCMP3155]